MTCQQLLTILCYLSDSKVSVNLSEPVRLLYFHFLWVSYLNGYTLPEQELQRSFCSWKFDIWHCFMSISRTGKCYVNTNAGPGSQIFFEIFELINQFSRPGHSLWHVFSSAWINLSIFRTRSQFVTHFLHCMKMLFLYGEGGPELGKCWLRNMCMLPKALIIIKVWSRNKIIV